MLIHVVQQGETIYSIADIYRVSADIVILENGLIAPYDLVIGQAIVITFPEQTHNVQEGDTLLSIANIYGITVLQILRNNPFLLDREFIYPGESLVISFKKNMPKIIVNGYANEFIDKAVLEKRLLYLTYLSIFGYRVVEDSEIVEIDDTELLRLTKSYGVAPLLVLTTLSTRGEEQIETAYTILSNEELMDKLVDNILIILKRKGYYGLNITYQLLNTATLASYESFTSKVYSRLKSEGFTLFITISPNQIFSETGIAFEKVDYSKIVQQADGIIIMNYNWGYSMSFPAPISSINRINDFLEYIMPYVLPDKIFIGQPLMAYDWELPYNIGLSRANSLTLSDAITLAKQYGSTILFDEASQTPYFYYNESVTDIARDHIVWFIDPRTINALLKLIMDRGLNGCGIWVIVNYDPQISLVINSQFEIENMIDSIT